MRNFMCYREDVPPLSFDGIHTACLSGDNGNGKSALIDAMTWALWGQARAKSDDDLLHSGQPEMEVEFDFAVGEQAFRVIRKRARPKRAGGAGQSLLEFQQAVDDGYTPITGNSIAQTQQKIVSTLHMDYDTFINSAFIRQGHADEFTTKRPAERKEVLASILGLAFYDDLEAQARELAKRQEMERGQLEIALSEIGDELAQRPAHEAEQAEAERILAEIEKVAKASDAKLSELRQRRDILERKKVQLDQLEARTSSTLDNLERWQVQVKQHVSRLEEYQGVIARRASIEEGYTRFAEARSRCDELNQKLLLLDRLKDRRNRLERAIDSAQAALVRDHDLMQSKISDLETRAGRLSQSQSQLQQLQTQLGQLAEREAALQQKKQAGRELQTQVSRLESRLIQYEQTIKELGEKIGLLSGQTEAKCPLCETELGGEGLQLIASKYSAEKQASAESLETRQAELEQKKSQLEALLQETSRLEAGLNQDRVSVQSRIGILGREVAEAQEASAQLTEMRGQLAEIESRLAGKDFATSEQAALSTLVGELTRLDYDPEQHEQVQQQMRDLEQYEAPKRKLEEAEQRIDQEKEAAARAEAAAQELSRGLETDNQQKQELTAELAELPPLITELAQVESEHQALERQQKQATEALWQVKARLQRLVELETRQQEKQALLAQTAREESIYRELVRAFGKGGIQALLIEVALPDIEVEANRLLGRMTDNRMHVKFETQRETKKGDVVETLDITISDELGTRSYEMFSGGEAFRINFAIRIALSRLLARRAGAPLPTLIIDEGFGTQDSTGIEKLREAITSIQDDFDKILVITHIEELRDAFPTRIDVVKTGQGSTLSVN
jgi:exonuclease SbcC